MRNGAGLTAEPAGFFTREESSEKMLDRFRSVATLSLAMKTTVQQNQLNLCATCRPDAAWGRAHGAMPHRVMRNGVLMSRHFVDIKYTFS
jgi:hypothetical protein